MWVFVSREKWLISENNSIYRGEKENDKNEKRKWRNENRDSREIRMNMTVTNPQRKMFLVRFIASYHLKRERGKWAQEAWEKKMA